MRGVRCEGWRVAGLPCKLWVLLRSSFISKWVVKKPEPQVAPCTFFKTTRCTGKAALRAVVIVPGCGCSGTIAQHLLLLLLLYMSANGQWLVLVGLARTDYFILLLLSSKLVAAVMSRLGKGARKERKAFNRMPSSEWSWF